MYQKKYSPEESLQRIKLMMKYDSSETLNENLIKVGVIKEQVGFGDIESVADDFNDYLTGDVETEDLTDIQNDLNTKIFGKRLKDGTCAMTKLLQYYEKISGNVSWRNFFTSTAVLAFGFSDWGRSGLIKDITNSEESGEAGFEDVKKELLDSIQKELDGFCKTQNATATPTTASTQTTGYTERQANVNKSFCSVKNGVISLPGAYVDKMKWEDYKTKYSVTDAEIDIAKKSCAGGSENSGKNRRGGSSYTACSGEYKRNCKSDVIKKVQACLGMPGKYQTGNFGPITQGYLQKLGKGFENGFKDADVDTICNKQTPTAPAPEISGEAPTVNFGSSDF